MHELTASEAATILAILSKDGGGESADIGPSGIPTSTFYATRRKMYDAGWLTDRYVPSPWAVGVLAIDCVLAKPSPAERARLEEDWASSAQNVVLWSGLNVVFGVFFRRGVDAPKVENGRVVSIAAGGGSLPVYFDYSRPWSRFIRVERETGYPRSLGGASAPSDRTSPLTVHELTVQDQNRSLAYPRAHLWHSSAGLSRGQQRLLDRGVVQSRTFLNLDAAPPYDGRELGEIVFLTGDLREGVSSGDVLAALNNECQVSPFFLADDGVRILILALGQVGSIASRRTKVPRAARPVAATLDSALKNLEMNVEHTNSVRKPIDHRYDRLFTPPRSPNGPRAEQSS